MSDNSPAVSPVPPQLAKMTNDGRPCSTTPATTPARSGLLEAWKSRPAQRRARRGGEQGADVHETSGLAGGIAGIARAGTGDGEFGVDDVDVAARRLLTMIDGLGAQKVVRAVPSDEAKHIARAYFASELGVVAR